MNASNKVFVVRSAEEKETKKGGREIQKKIWEEDPAAGECSGIFLCIIF